MSVEKVRIGNYLNYGEKMKAWVSGEEALPSTIEEFAAQLADANVEVTIPKRVKRVIFIQDDPETLRLRLPVKAFVEASERKFSGKSVEYPLPNFYKKAFGRNPEIDDLLSFHAKRVADYTLSNGE